MAAVWVAVLLVGSLSELLLVQGYSSPKQFRGKPGYKPGFQQKKPKISKAKIAGAAAVGVMGGMVISSALNHRRPEGRMENNRYQNINGTWVDTGNSGMVLCPLGSVWLTSSVLSFAYCVAV